MVATAARIDVEPNAPTTVPSRVRLFLDARGPDADDVTDWRTALDASAERLARAQGVQIVLRTAAWSRGTDFDAAVRGALDAGIGAAAGRPAPPGQVCFAGHDAGVLAARMPAGMVLVRNPTGISHSPEEEVSLEDAAVGANALVAALERLL
jgi:N-carbamoyl-L-amino-acid hydrolase